MHTNDQKRRTSQNKWLWQGPPGVSFVCTLDCCLDGITLKKLVESDITADSLVMTHVPRERRHALGIALVQCKTCNECLRAPLKKRTVLIEQKLYSFWSCSYPGGHV